MDVCRWPILRFRPRATLGGSYGVEDVAVYATENLAHKLNGAVDGEVGVVMSIPLTAGWKKVEQSKALPWRRSFSFSLPASRTRGEGRPGPLLDRNFSMALCPLDLVVAENDQVLQPSGNSLPLVSLLIDLVF